MNVLQSERKAFLMNSQYIMYINQHNQSIVETVTANSKKKIQKCVPLRAVNTFVRK